MTLSSVKSTPLSSQLHWSGWCTTYLSIKVKLDDCLVDMEVDTGAHCL